MEVEDLKTACRRFEKEHGAEGFLDAVAELMTERVAVQGLELRFFDDGPRTTSITLPVMSASRISRSPISGFEPMPIGRRGRAILTLNFF